MITETIRREAIWEALHAVYGHGLLAAKRVATDIDRSYRTTERWFQRGSVPTDATLLAIMLARPEFNDATLAAVRRRIAATQQRRDALNVRTQAAAVVADQDRGAGGQRGGRVSQGGGVGDGAGVAAAVTQPWDGVERRKAR